MAGPDADLGDVVGDPAGVDALDVGAYLLHPPGVGLARDGRPDQLRPAGEVLVDLRRGPAQQLADRAVASGDLDRGLREPVGPRHELSALAHVERVHGGQRGWPRVVGVGRQVEGQRPLHRRDRCRSGKRDDLLVER